MKPALKENSFLKKYDEIIFDLDGVITSEENYWNVASLTIYEFLNSNKYYGNCDFKPGIIIEKTESIRQEVFLNDKIISVSKNIGVNSNWDLAYIITALYLKYKTPSSVLDILKNHESGVDSLYEMSENIIMETTLKDKQFAKRGGEFWQNIVYCFQEWYLGDEDFKHNFKRENVQLGKKGLADFEVPLVDNHKVKTILTALNNSKIVLGVATGRPENEMSYPLKMWDLEKYFHKNKLVSYDYVSLAQQKLISKGSNTVLAKPNPYCFIKAVLGINFPDEEIFNQNYKIDKNILVVGDAGADILAAKSAGFDFLGVLSGVSAKKAEVLFKEENANYVLNDITALLDEVNL